MKYHAMFMTGGVVKKTFVASSTKPFVPMTALVSDLLSMNNKLISAALVFSLVVYKL